MGTKNKKTKRMWIDFRLDLAQAFEEKSFEKLLEYAKNNEHNLRSSWFNDDGSVINLILKQGTHSLSYFENSIEKNPELLSVFKLGVLSGYLEAFSSIVYEEQLNNIVKRRFEEMKLSFPEFQNYFEDILMAINNNEGEITEKTLTKKIYLTLKDLRHVLRILSSYGFISYFSSSMSRYLLTDDGRRLISQLAKKVPN